MQRIIDSHCRRRPVSIDSRCRTSLIHFKLIITLNKLNLMGPLNMLYHIELFEYTLIRILFTIYLTFGIQRIENHRFSLPTDSWVYRVALSSDFELIKSIKLNYLPPSPLHPLHPLASLHDLPYCWNWNGKVL